MIIYHNKVDLHDIHAICTKPQAWKEISRSAERRRQGTTYPMSELSYVACGKCGNPRSSEFYQVCDECYAKNLPTRIYDSAWVRIVSYTEKGKMNAKPENAKLRDLILTSFHNREIIPDPRRRIVVVGGRLEVPVEEKSLDDLARDSGLVIGKWLLYERGEVINKNWNMIAGSTLKGELGIDAKVSTAGQVDTSKEYVVCVYTRNYLDTVDVKRVRQRLRELGYTQRLYYKPDLYTYLNIYHKTFPSVRASRYAD